jgi:hypothetical protein
MWTAEAVLVCALSMLGRSVASLPPIELIRTLPPEVSRNAEAYVRLNHRRIYLLTTSPSFQDAQRSIDRCSDTMAIRKIASVIIHEETHLKQGADEETAYLAQLTTLTSLGAGPGSSAYRGVQLAMRQALRQQKQQQSRAPSGLIASARP